MRHTRSSPEIVRRSSEGNISLVAKLEDGRRDGGKVIASRGLAGINPLDCSGIAKVWNSCLNSCHVCCGPRLVVVDKFHVVNPAVNDNGNEKLHVEPEAEPVIRLFGADIVDHTWLVNFSFNLAAAVTWN